MITINGKSCALFIVIELCLISCSNKIDDNLFGTCNDVPDMNEIHIIHYPPVNKIIEVSGIRLAMDKAWTKMNENATKSGRCEYGFFIYAENDGSIHAGDMVRGDVVWYCEDSFATINLGIPVSNITVCAFFHCHTTLKHCPATVSRITGPSGNDEGYADEYQIPGILMDYSPTVIKGTEDDPFSDYTHKIYTFGPSQRPDLIIGQ